MTRAWVLAVPAVLAACATIAPPVVPAPARPGTAAAPSGADDLVAYLGSLRGLDDARLAAEVRTQRAALQRQPSDTLRVKAAIALVLTPADESEVLALVEPVARNPKAAPELLAMASFLHELASDRRRLKESAAAAQARSREERRAQEAQRLRADALQQKLEALTALEKSLSERTATPR